MERNKAWSWESRGEQPASPGQLPSLLGAVTDLEASWRLHIERAGGPGGMHAFLCTAAPRFLSMAAYLREQDRLILTDLVRLRSALEIHTGDQGWLQGEFARVARAMMVLDELETDVLCEALEPTSDAEWP